MRETLISTSGYNYKDWRGRLYPEGLAQKNWLSYFAEQFSTVEINNSFYGSVKPETYQKWYAVTPPSFRFAVKGHRYITQLKKLKGVEEATANFLHSAFELHDKLSVILWQFPASFHIPEDKEDEYLSRLDEFLAILPDSVRHAFEFRDMSWFSDDVAALLAEKNAAYVLSDTPVFPCKEIQTADFVYIRFHGPGALYASSYSDHELEQWAEKIKGYRQKKDVLAYFNNDVSGYAIENARRLRELTQQREVYQVGV